MAELGQGVPDRIVDGAHGHVSARDMGHGQIERQGRQGRGQGVETVAHDDQ